MWFPCRQILVDLSLKYEHDNTIETPRIYCDSDQAVDVVTFIDKNTQRIKFSIGIPEIFYIDIQSSAVVKEIKLDNFDINQNNLTKIFKIVPNKSKLPFNKNTVHRLPQKEGLRIYSKSFLLFNLYETDSISYLLSIGNKIEW